MPPGFKSKPHPFDEVSTMIKRIKRVRSDRKAKSKSNSMTPAPARRFQVFGQPQILEGEDAAACDELLARICDAIKPADIIEEMFIADVVSLEWEVLRWRRLKWTLVQATGLKALERFLIKQLEGNYALHEEHFERYLAEILRNNPPEDQADSADMLAAECAPNTAEAGAKLDKLLSSIGLNIDTVLDDARAQKAKELLQEYGRREPETVSLVDELLTYAGTSMDVFMADALAAKLDDIERIDRLSTIAEDRRNAHLTEIGRRRAVFGAMLRRSVQEIEEAEFKVIETTPAKGKNAA
jgi:hypothetical protein